MDVFRPHHEPAKTIYDALTEESKKRKDRTVDEWTTAERIVVWEAARDYAQQNALDVPTLDDIKVHERLAMGHVDYVAKWAYGVARLLDPKMSGLNALQTAS